MNYNHGVQTLLLKAKDETEDEMQTVTITKKQTIAKLCWKRIDRFTMEWQLFD